MLKKWVLKAVIQKSISYLPFGTSINYFFQKVTGRVQLTDEYFIDRLKHAQKHLAYYKKWGASATTAQLYELGTGWYPIIPVYFFLAGAKSISTLDIRCHISMQNFISTIDKFKEFDQKNLLGQYFDDPYNIARLSFDTSKIATVPEALQLVNTKQVICDAGRTPFPNDEFDLITSNNTFEHIYPQKLLEILAEMKRVLKSGGVMSHFIDLTDHFAHFDRSIHDFHFLKFSKSQWRWIDNSIQPLNRLRMPHYRELYHDTGIPISEEELIKSGNITAEEIKLDKDFGGIEPDQLLITHAYVISKI